MPTIVAFTAIAFKEQGLKKHPIDYQLSSHLP
jgi:hypothetical protein